MEGIWGGLVIALIDFLMVFIVLSGLALVIKGLKNVVAMIEHQPSVQEAAQVAQLASHPEPAGEPPQPQPEKTSDTHIAAIVTAMQQFTSLAPGTFTIDWIEPVEAEDIAGLTSERQHKALIAAITAAIHEYTLLPAGSFQITGIEPLGHVTPWKVAGRLEAMGIDV